MFVLLVGVTLFVVARVTINGTPQGAPGQAPPAPGGRGVPGFPAQQRPPGDPAVVERGKQVYGIYCRACHGADLRGGDQGGPNLLRSPVMLNDENGERLLPVVRGGRADVGMPAIDLTADDVTAVANYIHSVLATARPQGAPPEGPSLSLNVLVGDAVAGEAYFKADVCVVPLDDRGLAGNCALGFLIRCSYRISGSAAGGEGAALAAAPRLKTTRPRVGAP